MTLAYQPLQDQRGHESHFGPLRQPLQECPAARRGTRGLSTSRWVSAMSRGQGDRETHMGAGLSPETAVSEGLGGVTLPRDPGTAGGKGASQGGGAAPGLGAGRAGTRTACGPAPRLRLVRGGPCPMLTTEPGRSRQAPWDPAHLPTLPACEGGPARPRRLSDTPGSAVPLACGIARPLRRPSAPVELHWAHGAWEPTARAPARPAACVQAAAARHQAAPTPKS